jgi:hypothetical protein
MGENSPNLFTLMERNAEKVSFFTIFQHRPLYKRNVNISMISPGGVSQWTSYQPQKQKTRVRIPLGYKGFRENIAMQVCVIDLKCIACFVNLRKKY